MTINVSVESLKCVSEIAENFGLPEPLSRISDEMFGWYHIDSGWGYLKFEALTQTWRFVENDIVAEPAEPFVSIDGSEQARVLEDYNLLRNVAPEREPVDPNVMTFSRPFLHEKRTFGWVFVPALKRWELAVIGSQGASDERQGSSGV